MPEGQTAPKLGHEAPFMSVFPILLVTLVGTSAGFVTPYAAHSILQRGSQQSALGLIAPRRSLLQCPRPSGSACLLLHAPRGMGLAPSPDRTAARIRRLRTAEGVKIVVEAFTVCDEEMDAAASAHAEPSGA